jgi:hypothetical protein
MSTKEEKSIPVEPRKMPTKEEIQQMQQRSVRNQLQNVCDQSLGRADGIIRDAVRNIIENCLQMNMKIQNENEKLRNENNELRTKIANIEGSKLVKPVKITTKPK